MPTGTGASVLSTLPDVPYVIDGPTFASMTEKNIQPLDTVPAPGPGQSGTFFLPRTGVASLLKLVFQGTLTVTAAGTGQTQPVPSARWPYGLLDGFQLGAGMGNQRWDCDGLDLAALKQANRPFVSNLVDQFPGSFGGGGSALAAGSYPLSLTYEVPIAVDQTSLIASLFLQSSSATVQCQISQALLSDLVEAGGTTALWSITGAFQPSLTMWDIPVDSKGNLILPEIDKMHLFVSIDEPIAGTGRQPAPVQRTAGILQRLFLRSSLSRVSFLSALPSTPTSALIDRITLNYGLTNNPLDYNPASVLAMDNNDWYGSPLPYDTYAIDTLRQNPARDAILLQGITNLQALMYIDPAVTVGPNAKTHVVEEILV